MSFSTPAGTGVPRRPAGPGSRRFRALLPTLFVVGVLLVLFSIFTGIYTDLLWFDSLNYRSVFTKQLITRFLLFLVFGLVVAGAVAANFVIAYRARPAYQGMLPGQQELDRYRMAVDPYRRLIVLALVGMLGLITGSTAASEWRTYLQWRHGEPFGVKDPQFGRDVSFFAFDLPWWRFVLAFAFATVVLSLIAATITHYLYGGLRLQATLGERATPAARVHLSVLLGTFVLLKAVAYWLDRYGLAVKESRISKSEFTGLTFTDVNAVLPGRSILAVISLICAALFFANVVRRTWLLPGLGVGLLILSAILVGGVYPRVVQQFQVKPSEPDKEAPYIERNIEATRTAYGIDDAKVKVQDYNAETESSPGQLRADSDTTASVRLLDPAVLSPTYKNLQQIKGYYDFQDTLDVDRYQIDGETRDVVTAVREVSLQGIEERQRNWINDHTVYTHGFGFVAALGNQVSGGRPTFVSSDIPPKGKLGKFEPRIYFGEESPPYSIVGGQPEGKPLELDFPDDSEETTGGARNNTYSGKGGVAINSFWRKLLYATKYQDANLILSGRVNSESKILDIRTPKERLERVAPWLTLDGDPYPAAIDGRIKWIIDGYTTTNGYPYATRSTLEDVTEDSQTTSATTLVAPVQRVNYIRNSVKATVDAFDGTVELYQWDDKDPVLKTWMKAFPGTVDPRSAISDDLMDHLRYPEDLFKVQRSLLARYHVQSAQGFYNGGDFWRVPVDPTETNKRLQPPYYLTLKMPGQSEPTFSLTSTFVPIGRRENLVAFMAVNADPGPDYGTFRVLQLPRSVQINGPSQVQNEFSADAEVARVINILTQGDSKVEYGNLLTLPVGGGLLYVEPVYVQAQSDTSFPILEKVLVSFGNKIAFEDTLQQALDAVFAGESGVSTGETPTNTPTPDASPSPSPTGTSPATSSPTASPRGDEALSRALADAEKALAESRAALAKGDFTAYGAAQKRLEDAIRRAVTAQPRGPRASPTSTASPSPSPSPTG